MPLSQLNFIILTVVAISTGQILFKMAASEFELSVVGFLNSLSNIKLICALIIYFLATTMWLLVLKITPLRIAYPFVSMAFFIVPILAHFLLNEKLSWNTFIGASLIGAGVWVSVYE
ncbi:EamA family transporter [Methylomicrobium sp. RS1]|jgi:drug/metabolite transporter (DMT)-like permease|uniref:EamA family transporter n=1 Tax=Candidatus Methylomicrobium oryzae TaxID=2802053 RepID=UPI001924717F|nr:EamA family transporter [Methylomicrobium sp. RS1]MBL1262523.1 EamA family transporter [Methylomicrobium sp. RS1]